MPEGSAVRPMPLRKTAKAIAQQYGDKGAIVITHSADGDIRIGAEGLTPHELREALCTAIHYSYVFEEG